MQWGKTRGTQIRDGNLHSYTKARGQLVISSALYSGSTHLLSPLSLQRSSLQSRTNSSQSHKSFRSTLTSNSFFHFAVWDPQKLK